MAQRFLVVRRVVARLGGLDAVEPRHNVARALLALELDVAACTRNELPAVLGDGRPGELGMLLMYRR